MFTDRFGSTATVRDIPDRKRVIEELHHEQEFVHVLLDNLSGDGVIACNSHGAIVLCNQHIYQLFLRTLGM